MLHILLLNICVVINHANMCIDLFFFRINILHVQVPKKNFDEIGQNFLIPKFCTMLRAVEA